MIQLAPDPASRPGSSDNDKSPAASEQAAPLPVTDPVPRVPPRAKSGSRRAAWMRWLRRAVLLGVGLAIALGIALAWMPRPVPVDMAVVERGPLRVTVDEDGLARVKDRFMVSAPLGGSLARIELNPGDTVGQGQVVARIVPMMPPLLDERTRQSAEVRVAATLAAQRQARAQIERSKANMEYAKAESARASELYERGALPRAEVDRAELAARTSRAELDSLEFGARVADHELEMARVALRHLTAPKHGAPGEQLLVSSPIAGRVLKLMHKSEGVVQPGTPLLEVGDPAALEIAADVLTSDAVRIAPGAAVILSRWGGEPLEGRVRHVEPSAFTRLSALGVEEQRVNVLIDLAAPRERWERLGDGYRIEAQVVVWEAESVLKVPASAVFRRGSGWAAFRVENGIAHLTPIEIDHRTGREVEIIKGLDAGARLIVHPSDRVSEGAEVVQR